MLVNPPNLTFQRALTYWELSEGNHIAGTRFESTTECNLPKRNTE